MNRYERLRSPETEAMIQFDFEAGDNVSKIAERHGMTKNAVIGMARRRKWTFGGTTTRQDGLLRRARLFLRLPPVHRYAGATLFSRLDAINAEFEALTKGKLRALT